MYYTNFPLFLQIFSHLQQSQPDLISASRLWQCDQAAWLGLSASYQMMGLQVLHNLRNPAWCPPPPRDSVLGEEREQGQEAGGR